MSVVNLCRCSVYVQDEKDKESGWKAAQYKNGDSVVSLRLDKKNAQQIQEKEILNVSAKQQQTNDKRVCR